MKTIKQTIEDKNNVIASDDDDQTVQKFIELVKEEQEKELSKLIMDK